MASATVLLKEGKSYTYTDGVISLRFTPDQAVPVTGRALIDKLKTISCLSVGEHADKPVVPLAKTPVVAPKAITQVRPLKPVPAPAPEPEPEEEPEPEPDAEEELADSEGAVEGDEPEAELPEEVIEEEPEPAPAPVKPAANKGGNKGGGNKGKKG